MVFRSGSFYKTIVHDTEDSFHSKKFSGLPGFGTLVTTIASLFGCMSVKRISDDGQIRKFIPSVRSWKLSPDSGDMSNGRSPPFSDKLCVLFVVNTIPGIPEVS